jgi:hypothetical protein
MSDAKTITASHRERLAVAYLRQSSPAQVRQNGLAPVWWTHFLSDVNLLRRRNGGAING